MAVPIRIGIVGAGRFTRRYHIPNLQRLPDVQVVAVCNRTRESSEQVAQQFGIPRVCTDWHELVADPALDAVVVGTLPDLRPAVTIAALEAGKHVLAEAAMAPDLSRAEAMYAASQARPHLKTLLSSMARVARGDGLMRQLLADGYVGEIRQVIDYRLDARYADPTTPVEWRQSRRASGLNFQFLGERANIIRRWLGEHHRVMAQLRTFAPDRPGAKSEGQLPDTMNVLAELVDGTPVAYLHSGVTRFSDRPRVEIYGSAGTLVYALEVGPGAGPEEILGAQVGDERLEPIGLPEAHVSPENIDAAFIAMIRDDAAPPPEYSTFYDGMKYLEFLDACFASAESGCWIDLPGRPEVR